MTSPAGRWVKALLRLEIVGWRGELEAGDEKERRIQSLDESWCRRVANCQRQLTLLKGRRKLIWKTGDAGQGHQRSGEVPGWQGQRRRARGRMHRPAGKREEPCTLSWAGFPCARLRGPPAEAPLGATAGSASDPRGDGWADKPWEERNAIFAFRVCGREAVAPLTRTLGIGRWTGQMFGGGWRSAFSCFHFLWAQGARPGTGPVKEGWSGSCCLRFHWRTSDTGNATTTGPAFLAPPPDFITSLLRTHLALCASLVPGTLCRTVCLLDLI